MDYAKEREPLKASAYDWTLDRLDMISSLGNRTPIVIDAVLDYHGMVDGIVWSDELPALDDADRAELQRVFCVLVHLRTSVILGESISPNAEKVLTAIRQNAPDWSFCNASRWDHERARDYERVRTQFFRKMNRLCAPNG